MKEEKVDFGKHSSANNCKDLLHLEFTGFKPVINLNRRNDPFTIFKIKLIIKLIVEQFYYFFKRPEKITEYGVWAICSSTNNLNSLLFLKNKVKDLEFISTNSLKKTESLKNFI